MKAIVFSDVHGRKEIVERIIEFNPDADYIISLGDSELEQDYFLNRDIVHVKGNYPRDPGFVYETDLDIEDLTLFITHGHKFKVHRSLEKLIKHGVANGYDIVLFGHTHIIEKQKFGSTWIINPGSCSSPRNHFPPSYCILEIQGKDVQFTFKEVLTNRTLEV